MGTPDKVMRSTREPHRPIPDRPAQIRCRARARGPEGPTLKVTGARANNLKDVTVEIPLGTVDLRDRRLGRRQVDAGDRDALQGAGASG
jgi:excinuclease UvrABC ATPase subunit